MSEDSGEPLSPVPAEKRSLPADPVPEPAPAPVPAAGRGHRTRRRLIATATTSVVLVGVVAGLLIVANWLIGPATLTLSATIAAPGGWGANGVTFSPDSKTLAVADSSNTSLWDVPAGHRVATLTGGTVAFSPDGKTMAVFGGDTELFDTATHRLVATLSSDCLGGTDVAFSPDGETMASNDGNNTCLFSIAAKRPIATFTDPADSNPDAVRGTPAPFDTNAGIDDPAGVAFSPDGRILAACDGNDRVSLWDAATHRNIATLTAPSGDGIDDVAFSPDGKILAATTSGSGSVILWDTATHQIITTLSNSDTSPYPLYMVAFSPDGRVLAANGPWGGFVWNVPTHALTATFNGDDITGLAFSPDGRFLATSDGDEDGDVYLWRPPSG